TAIWRVVNVDCCCWIYAIRSMNLSARLLQIVGSLTPVKIYTCEQISYFDRRRIGWIGYIQRWVLYKGIVRLPPLVFIVIQFRISLIDDILCSSISVVSAIGETITTFGEVAQSYVLDNRPVGITIRHIQFDD